MGGVRMAARIWHEDRTRGHVQRAGTENRVLLVGAGVAGTRTAREMRRHPEATMIPVGFLDDDRTKRRLSITGLPVLGTIEDLPTAVKMHEVQEVLITMPSATGAVTRRVVELARESGVRCRILPGVTEMLSGSVDLFQVRDVQVEDLLRREPIELDLSGSSNYVSGHTVLITGAGGSIGSEIVRQVARLSPARVVLLGQGENSLHAIGQELARELPGLEQTIVVGTVRDPEKLSEVMSTFHPYAVFHAAAHKHIPLMEGDPDEAILNNVGGTKNIAEAAIAANVRRFVSISTDKAVNPASMVGATKQIAEKVVRALAREATNESALVSVRFGNVLGSRGSVIPVFQEQIRRGGPITLTHRDMTRYFMTIPEASRLVIQAGALAENGAVYLLDMGQPVRIQELAHDMIRLSGADPEAISISYTGLRPGEKLVEELFTADEHVERTRFDQIMIGRSEAPVAHDFLKTVDELLDAASSRDWVDIDRVLTQLVPGFDLGPKGTLQARA
jgi:FlaA1/EpsC-like NDP-sugar epimerase